MHEFITQPIPGGCLTAELQVDEALSVIVTAAQLLEFSSLYELENPLGELREPLLLLAAAGELAEVSFSMQDSNGVFGVRVIIDPYGVSDYEEVDLSRLRLLASPEAVGQIDIVCLDSEFVAGLLGEDWLPGSSDTLTVALSFSTDNDIVDDPKHWEEECDDDDNDSEDWREPAREIDDLYN